MVIRVTESDYKKYNEFLEKSENGHFMQSLSWRDFKCGQRSFALMCENDDGEVLGVMLLLLHKVRRSNKVFLKELKRPLKNRLEMRRRMLLIL